MCLAGTEAASWSLTQEAAGSSPSTAMTNILSLNSTNSMKTFKENSNATEANVFLSSVNARISAYA